MGDRFDVVYFSSTNHAVRVTAPEKVSLEALPLSVLGSQDVRIAVSFVGVCKTDLEVADGSLGYYRDGRAWYPIIPGHEFFGVVAALGAEVRGFSVGDRVVGECILSCGSCLYCKRGSHSACAARREVGVMNYDGAYARFVALPAHRVHKVSDGLDDKSACLAEPLAVVLRALRRIETRLRTGDRVAVIGAGLIGNLAAQVLFHRGHRVTVFNRSAPRLQHFSSSIATSQQLRGLDQFDTLVEASGNIEALQAALEQSRSDATLLLLGFPYGKLDYHFEDLVGREKVIVGSVGGAPEDFRVALALLPELNTKPFTEVILPLEDFHKAWDLHRSSNYLKVLLSLL